MVGFYQCLPSIYLLFTLLRHSLALFWWWSSQVVGASCHQIEGESGAWGILSSPCRPQCAGHLVSRSSLLGEKEDDVKPPPGATHVGLCLYYREEPHKACRPPPHILNDAWGALLQASTDGWLIFFPWLTVASSSILVLQNLLVCLSTTSRHRHLCPSRGSL